MGLVGLDQESQGGGARGAKLSQLVEGLERRVFHLRLPRDSRWGGGKRGVRGVKT